MNESAVQSTQTKEPAPVAWTESGVQLQSLDDAYRFARYVVASGMAPGLKDEVSVVVALQAGMELGFSPMRSLQVVHVIKGRPSLAVEAMGAKVESDGVLEAGTKLRYRYLEKEGDMGCQAYSTPAGGQMIESEPVWMSDFKHLAANDNWKKYPKRMLKARAVGYHIRDYYAASVNNLPTSEEMREVSSMRGRSPVERDITPPPTHHPLLAGASGGEQPASDASSKAPEPVDAATATGSPSDQPVEADVLQFTIQCCAKFEGWGRMEGDDAETCVHCGAVRPGTDEGNHE